MQSEILKQTLLNLVVRVAQHVGFEQASMQAVDVLSEILFKYMKSISKSVADLATDDEYFSVLDGLAILELTNESLPDLLKYAREAGPYFPKPPNMCVPLAGRIELNLSIEKEQSFGFTSQASLPEPFNSEQISDSPDVSRDTCSGGQISTASQGRNKRKIPSWAGRSKYKLTRVSYDSTLGLLVEHELPPPVIPVVPSIKPSASAKRRSTRSTASIFRKQPSSVLSDSDDAVGSQVVPSPKPARTAIEMWESAMRASVQSPPAVCNKLNDTSPSRSISACDNAPAEATVTLQSHEITSLIEKKSHIPSQNVNRRSSQNRKKRLGWTRKRFQSTTKRLIHKIKPPVPGVSEISEVNKDELVDINPSPILTAVSSSCSSPEFQATIDNPVNATLDSKSLGSHAPDVHSTASTEPRSPTLVSKPIIEIAPGGDPMVIGPSSFIDSLVNSDDNASFARRSSTASPVSGGLMQAGLPSSGHGILSNASPSDDGFIKNEDTNSPVASDSCTEPLTNEESSRDYEMPRVFNFPPTRRSSFSVSSPSSSPSSSSSSLSSSNADLSKSIAPSAPPPPPSLPRNFSPQLSIQQPLSDHSSRTSSSLLGLMTSQQPASVIATGPIKIPQKASTSTGGGIRIKIRLGGPDGEALSLRSSEPSSTNTNPCPSSSSCSSSTSSSASSPLSSSQVSDEATTARRHAAIPPALVAKVQNHEPVSSFGSLVAKEQLHEPSVSQQSLVGVKTPKLVIKFGSHEHGSTSIVRSLDQKISQLKSAFTQEKLRGSSISSIGSSSSSSSSQSTDDEEETSISRLPHLHLLERLPNVRISGNCPSQPPTLLLLNDRSTENTSPVSQCRKLPPQLQPLHLVPSVSTLTSSLNASRSTIHSPASSFGRCSNKSFSKLVQKGSHDKHVAQVQLKGPKLNALRPSYGKRVMVDSVFSDDEEENEIGNSKSNLNVRSQNNHGRHKHDRHGPKRKRLKDNRPQMSRQASPPTTQIIAASAGTSYYFNNAGEQIWLCPICRTEDDGNLMVGCDSCDDWYHSSCLGLSEEPQSAQWFCPKCSSERLERSMLTSSTLKKHSGKYSGGRHRGR